MEKPASAPGSLPRPALARRASHASRVPRRLLSLLQLLGALGLLCWLLPRVPSHLSPFSSLQQQQQQRHSGKLNVILMISDGYGPASETLGRAALSLLAHAETHHNVLPHTPLDRLLVGSHRSASADSLITDSAAGATAFACGEKSYNGAIGVDAHGRACGTVFEAAKLRGWSTGVVVTSRLTDATPGAFISHVASRAQEPLIALHSLGHDAASFNISADLGPGTAPLTRPLDLAIGGGGCVYLPRAHPQSCRADEADLVGVAQREGWDVRFGKAFNVSSSLGVAGAHGEASQQSMEQLASLSALQHGSDDDLFLHAKTPLLALLSPSNTPYEIDRLSLPSSLRHAFPSLKSLALAALRLLSESESNRKGLLLMVEGSQIDLGGHMNDPATHTREIVAYQEAIQAVREWVDEANKRGERSVLISTSDHETGGLTLGRQLSAAYPNYAYHPSVLLRPTASASALSSQLIAFARGSVPRPSPADVRAFIAHETLGKGAGFVEGAPHGGAASEEEVTRVLEAIKETTPDGGASEGFVPPINTADEARKVIADCISRRAEVGWSTTGHTGVDIPVHAHGYRGAIGAFIARTLGLDLKATTEALRKHK